MRRGTRDQSARHSQFMAEAGTIRPTIREFVNAAERLISRLDDFGMRGDPRWMLEITRLEKLIDAWWRR